MSIRMARADDLWKKVFSRSYVSRYSQLYYENLSCLGNGNVQFEGGISVIVGGNGVGKSTLAAALGELLQTELRERYVGERSRLAGSTLKGLVLEENRDIRREASSTPDGKRELSGDPVAVENWWLDPPYWAFHTRKQITRDQNFQDVIEPLTPIEVDAKQLSTLEYVIGKKYERCLIYEISEYADLDRFPYFRVSSNGLQYGSEGMGQGELALMLILWVLQDLRSNSILVLEEPECHVSPRAQAALMNVIAEAAATKGVWTIITTHSPTIMEKVPTKHLRLLVRDGAGTKIISEVRRHQVAAILGSSAAFTGIALVEDEVARELTVAALDELAPDLLRQLEISSVGGEARISAVLSSLPRSGSKLRLLGIYDGDQRGKVSDQQINWPFVFLPGENDPARLLKDALDMSGGIDLLATELRRDRNSIAATLDALTGLEPRDWIIECVKTLVVTKADLVRALLRMFLQTEKGKELTYGFVKSVEEGYDSCS